MNIEKLDKREILRLNLEFLFAKAGRGSKNGLADYLGIPNTTIARWGKIQEFGLRLPPQKTVERIKKYFSVPTDIDLQKDPLFLLNINSTHKPYELFKRLMNLMDKIGSSLNDDDIDLIEDFIELMMRRHLKKCLNYPVN